MVAPGLEQQVGGERDAPAGEEGVIGGSPTSSVKRRASAARETPVSAASSATVQGWAGVVVEQPQRAADDRVAVGAVPGGRLGVGPCEPCAQDGDQQQVEQPVEHDLLARARP